MLTTVFEKANVLGKSCSMYRAYRIVIATDLAVMGVKLWNFKCDFSESFNNKIRYLLMSTLNRDREANGVESTIQIRNFHI